MALTDIKLSFRIQRIKYPYNTLTISIQRIQQNMEQSIINQNITSRTFRSAKPGIYFQEDVDTDPEDIYVPKTSRRINTYSQSPERRKILTKKLVFPLEEPVINTVLDKQPEEPDNQQSQLSFEQKMQKMFTNLKHVKDFLYKPTLRDQKLKMNVTVTENAGKRKFVARVSFQGKDVYLATKKQGLTDTKYEISLLPDFVENIECEPFFIGSMVYDHNVYQVTDDGRFPVHTNEMIKRRVASIFIQEVLFSTPKVILITPQVQNNEMCTIEANPASEFLQLLSLSIQSTPLEQYVNLKMSKSDQEQISGQMGCRASKKTMIVKNKSKDSYAIAVGRVNDVEYKVNLIDGLSPYQAFCLFVAWLS